MTKIQARAGEIIQDGYPPTMVVADIHDGVVTFLKLNNPEENIGDLLTEADRLRSLRLTRNRRLDKRPRIR
jgi:hypothetical protein